MEVLERYRPIIDDFEAFEAACRRPLPKVVRVNPIKTTPAAVQSLFDTTGIAYEPVDWSDRLLRLATDAPGRTLGWYLGWVHGQEEVSALPAHLLDPAPGDRVLDACAAPGSKTTQLAALMDDRGRLIANDSNLGRLSALRSNAERLGLTNVAVTNRDGRELSFEAFSFDRVDAALVDVPCSCEGTIRKNPDALDRWSRDHVEGLSGVQKGLLRRAVRLTAPGGRVVYSTCTFAPEENEAVLDHVLEKEDCQLIDQDLPIEHAPGVTKWNGETYDPAVRRAARIYPHHNDTGGFFCATIEVGA